MSKLAAEMSKLADDMPKLAAEMSKPAENYKIGRKWQNKTKNVKTCHKNSKFYPID